MAGAEMIDNVVHAAIVMTTPVLLAAIGGLVNRVGGIVNIGLDSMMLAGALLGLIIASSTGSWGAALVMAALAGGVLGLLMSLAITRLDANEIIVGLGFNIAVAGLVRFFLKSAYGSSGTLNLPDVARLPRIDIPVLADIPILGAVLSGHDPADLGRVADGASDGLVPRAHARGTEAAGCRCGSAGGAGAGPQPACTTRRVDGVCRSDGRACRCLSLDRCRRDLQ